MRPDRSESSIVEPPGEAFERGGIVDVVNMIYEALDFILGEFVNKFLHLYDEFARNDRGTGSDVTVERCQRSSRCYNCGGKREDSSKIHGEVQMGC